MGEMRDEGLFSDSKLPEDRYVVIQVETNVENPDLFEYIWDKKDIFEYSIFLRFAPALELRIQRLDPPHSHPTVCPLYGGQWALLTSIREAAKK